VSFICGLVWITCQLTAVTVFSSSTSFFVTVSSLTVFESWQIYREYGPFDPLYPLLPLLCLENPAVVLRIVFSFCTFFVLDFLVYSGAFYNFYTYLYCGGTSAQNC